MLLAEYIDDIVVSQNAHVIKSHKDSLWSLVTKLSSAFEHPNPAAHYLFESTPEISENGIKNILSFYESGKSCFQQILAQDVYKTEPRVAVGRRIQNISYYTYAKLESAEKHKPVEAPTVQQNTPPTSPPASEPIRQIQSRRITTGEEKMILAQLFEFEENLPESAILKVLSELQTVSLDWTVERVKQYWRNNWRNKVQSKV
jgi:hypothetical protein